MKEIDRSTWSREPHFQFFRTFRDPFFDVSSRIDVTGLVAQARVEKLGLFAAFMHVILTAANEIPEFRLRFRGEQVFEIPACHSSFTFMGDNGLFNYATTEYHEDRQVFAERVRKAAAEKKHLKRLNLDDDQSLELVYCTSLPWTDILGVSHAFSGKEDDCFPRITWGRIVATEDGFEVTLQVTAHHGLVDGHHTARLIERVRELTC